MSFVQLIDCRTTRHEKIREIDAEWEKATQGRRTLRRQITTRDRKDPGRHVGATPAAVAATCTPTELAFTGFPEYRKFRAAGGCAGR